MSNPLAGFGFALQLQTHRGNGIPIGLWQDVDGTIPATQDFDPVALWTDEVGGTLLSASQTDVSKQPFLLFIDDIPSVVFDGVDDCLDGNLTVVGEDFTAGALATIEGGIFARILVISTDFETNDYDGVDRAAVLLRANSDPSVCSYRQVQLAATAITLGAAFASIAQFDGTLQTIQVESNTPNSFISTGSFASEVFRIGNSIDLSSPLSGSCVAILAKVGLLSSGQIADTQSYLSDLKIVTPDSTVTSVTVSPFGFGFGFNQW